MRRGLYRPDSINSHAGSESGGVGSPSVFTVLVLVVVVSIRSLCPLTSRGFLFHRLDLYFPSLRRGHAGPIGALAHELARRRSVRHKDHSLWDVPFFALKKGLAIVRSNSHGAAGTDASCFHVIDVHHDGVDDGLVLGGVFADVYLLALL